MKSNHICMGVAWCVILVAACSPTIVEPIGGGPGSGCAPSTDSCGGSAGDLVRGGGPGSAGVPTGGQNAGAPGGQNAGAPGGPSNGGSGGTGAGSGTGGAPEGGGPDEVTCSGLMDEVRDIWGECPPMLCAGVAWAQSCPGSSLGAIAEVGTCDGLGLITLDFGTHGKACYYQPAVFQEPKLVGVAAWDDTPHYCDGTSFRIQAGTAPAVCVRQSASKVACGGSSGAPDASAGAGGQAGGGDTPPEPGPSACYDAFSNSCQPCCPTPTPDCAGKPNGYPGYSCTPAPNSFCSCQCASGTWDCAC